MRNFDDLTATLLPILFITLCLRVGFEAISPIALPLFILAAVILAAWLWVRLRI